MCLLVSSLNSGSNGNCYYIGNENEAILIDAGISCREIERRLKRLQLPISKIRAVFISHEHTDHIKGIETLSKKYHVPVYITDSTLKNSNLKIEKNLLVSFSEQEYVSVRELNIFPFQKNHDAADPYSFVVEYNNIRVGVFTDIGFACENLIHHFQQCNAAFLEANYDEKMLDEGSYPLHLKQRIRSKVGHLSNMQALELFKTYKPPQMTHLFLSHLSENNNHPKIAEDLFSKHAGNVKIIVAGRKNETPVFEITASQSSQPTILSKRAKQLSFYFE